MACAGVIASAGAQLDFTTMTVGSRTGFKFIGFGFNSSAGMGSLSKTALETQSGNARTCTQIEDLGSQIRLQLTSGDDSDAAGFRRIVIGSLSLNRSDRVAFSSGAWNWNSTSAVISDANGSTLVVELRAD